MYIFFVKRTYCRRTILKYFRKMGPELNNVILLADSYKIRKYTIRITHFKIHITLLTWGIYFVDKLFHPSPTSLWKECFSVILTLKGKGG